MPTEICSAAPTLYDVKNRNEITERLHIMKTNIARTTERLNRINAALYGEQGMEQKKAQILTPDSDKPIGGTFFLALYNSIVDLNRQNEELRIAMDILESNVFYGVELNDETMPQQGID